MAKIDPSKIHTTLDTSAGTWRGNASSSLNQPNAGTTPPHEIVHVVINATYPLEEQNDRAKATEEAKLKGRDHIHRLIKQYREDSGE